MRAIIRFVTNIGNCRLLVGSSYIHMPKSIVHRLKCERCFVWAVLTALHLVETHKYADTVSKYQKLMNTSDSTWITILNGAKLIGDV